MAISATYLQMQQAIADELGDRTELLVPLADTGLADSPIKRAIQSAIAKWETEIFWFTESRDAAFFTTVAGQEFYGGADAVAITTTPDIEELSVVIGQFRRPLRKRSWEFMEDQSTNPVFRGPPYDWAYFAEQIRLYPIPDNAYSVISNRTQRVAALVSDADSSIWTQAGYDLIRSEAKLILARELLHDDDIAARMQAAIYGNPALGERGYLAPLKGETLRRAKSKIRPSQF